MAQQIRWRCSACDREWQDMGDALSHSEGWHWTPDMGCFICGSRAIAEVKYHAAFPGADIPRDEPQAMPPAIVPYRRTNQTLAMSTASPEFD